jgi:hypothetical protein
MFLQCNSWISFFDLALFWSLSAVIFLQNTKLIRSLRIIGEINRIKKAHLFIHYLDK